MRCVTVLLAVVWASAVLADDVKVHVIKPDEHKAADTKTGSGPAGTGTRTTSDAPVTGESVRGERGGRRGMFGGRGDPVIRRALERCKLTDDQRAKIDPMVEESNKEVEKGTAQFQAQREELQKQLGDLLGKKDGSGTEQVSKLTGDMRKAEQQSSEVRRSARGPLADKIVPVLTEEQAKVFKQALEDLADTPEARAKQMARFTLDLAAPGVKLSDEQRAKLEEPLKKIAEESEKQFRENADRTLELGMKAAAGDEAARKELFELRDKMWRQGRDGQKNIRELLDGVLTPEQKAQAEKGRQAGLRDFANMRLGFEAGRYERLDLTEDQKAKVKELREAAQEALTKAASDRDAQRELVSKLRKDIEGLLTDEQKKKLEEQPRWRPGGPGQGPGGEGWPGRGGRDRGERGERGDRGGERPAPVVPPAN